jgi:23S rRNA (cytosine1962-C5)-methyltransferase
MIDFTQFTSELEKNAKKLDCEFKRLFHGRGGLWEEWRFLTVDSIDTILLVQFFYEIEEEIQNKVLNFLRSFMQHSRHNTIVLKRRYIKGSVTQLIEGEITGNEVAIENGMKFTLNLTSNQNIGYFGDMKNGRSYIENIAKDAHVLNLFSYTCGFSLFAKRGGAKSVVNVDMSKSVLATGQKNHQINNLPTKGVSFLPYNILKSFARLKKKGPFDIIIIDPPTFQKGSFEATKDYKKIITKLPQLASEKCVLLACLNAPDLDESFVIELIKELAPSFKFKKRLPNLQEYKSLDEKRSLKNLVFQREI